MFERFRVVDNQELLPFTQLVTACAPVPRNRVRGDSVGALKKLQIPVPGVRQWVPALRELAATGEVQWGNDSFSNLRLTSGKDGIEIGVETGLGTATFFFRHDRLTGPFYAGDWVTVAPGVEARGELVMPRLSLSNGDVLATFATPIEFRVSLSQWSRWLRGTITVGCEGLRINENGAVPIWTKSWTGRLARLIVEPSIIFTEQNPGLLLSVGGAATDQRKRRRERSLDKTADEWRLDAADLVSEYQQECWNTGVAATPHGAEEYVWQEIRRRARKQQPVGSGVVAMVVWMLIRTIVWNVILAFFEDFDGVGCDGE